MISLYSGTPGSGKSLHLARTVRDSLKFSCPVIGTFHINKDMLWKNSKYPYTYINIYDLTPRDLLKYAEDNKKYLKHNVEGSFLLVIDECQRIFNSRTWQETKNRNEWITFFAEHRHFGFNIILVSQMDIMIDRQIRGLIEYNYLHRKVDGFGFGGKLLSMLTGNFCIVKTWYAIKGFNVGSEFLRGNKKLFNFYDTFEDFALDRGEVRESSRDQREDFASRLKEIPCIVDIHGGNYDTPMVFSVHRKENIKNEQKILWMWSYTKLCDYCIS